MNNIQWKSLKLRLALVVSAAFIFASIVFIVFSQSISWNLIYGNLFFDQWKGMASETIEEYQKYITENDLSKEAVLNNETWEHEYNNVSIGITGSPKATYWEAGGFEQEQGIPINCSDGMVYAYVSPSFKYSNGPGIIAGFIVASLVFFAVIIPYIYSLMRRISRLTEKNETANAELLKQMEETNEAVMTNSRLITSLSHDFRTPLTRLTGYLEILKFRKFKGEEGFDKYLDSALRNASQMKNLSDEMFDFFRVQTVKGASEPVTDKKINDILTGIFNDLKQEKYEVKYDITECSYKLLIKEYYVRRIFDNLFSNVRKYADPEKPVEIKTEKTGDTVILKISNQIKANPEADSNGIGLTTVKILMEQSGGKLERNVNEDTFTISLMLPVKTENE